MIIALLYPHFQVSFGLLRCIYNYLYPRKVIGKKRKLYGPNTDGGYVLLDDFEDIKIKLLIVSELGYLLILIKN